MLLRPTTPESLDRLVNYLEKHRGLEWSIVNGANESYRDWWIRTAKEAIQANDGVIIEVYWHASQCFIHWHKHEALETVDEYLESEMVKGQNQKNWSASLGRTSQGGKR